ncbi:heparinase II/III-like protein [Rhodococcus rhodochrous J45]|uniref:Heparinase II/III-like protein n=1 Tax=Rhodococcus rhodochrous J45 TaxID=935266 RepID=A0A562EM61_RHORH|nr:alginate lyase family protein [Rhodococcus rhodochrous]TWH23070.1 heparinase II/III-like protein [Rhodococcus rhodochrous J45]
MERSTWYARRLSTMEPAEIGWRVRNATLQRIPHRRPDDSRLLGPGFDWHRSSARFRASTNRPVLLERDRAKAIAAAGTAAVTLAAAERVLSHRFTFFGYPEATLGTAIDWNHDPVEGADWPCIPSRRIDYRTAGTDPKWIWELNRLQHLPWLSQAWLLTGDGRYADEAFAQLDSWITHNPPGYGLAWSGAFEVGLRAISVSVALQGLKDHHGLTVERFRSVVRMLAESARRCWADRSRFSSANNHLVGELTGLAIVAILFPELRSAARWEHDAVASLCTEAELQILPDGSGAEQAVGYQVFTTELFLLVALLLKRRDNCVPPQLSRAITRSAQYLAAVVGDHDPAPRYGDDDEGFALRLDPSPVRTVRDHLGLVGAVLDVPEAKRAGTRPPAADWLSPPDAHPTPDGRSSCPASFGSFHASDGGLAVLRAGGRRITMDTGPLGYLSIAAHGHADALAVTLSVDGQELIGDPGAASYCRHPAWRSVHRGTRVHPTVSVDEQDQSVIGGPFLWTRHARVRTDSVDPDRGIVDARHDGYARLDFPVIHRRRLIAPPCCNTVVVVDVLSGSGSHTFRTNWPLHPSLEAVPDGDGHIVSRDGVAVLQLAYAASSGCIRRDEVRGDTETNLGWWSNRLESRVPAWLVGSVVHTGTPVVLATALAPLRDSKTTVSGLAVALYDEAVVVRWQDQDGAHVYNFPSSGGISTHDLPSEAAICTVHRIDEATGVHPWNRPSVS